MDRTITLNDSWQVFETDKKVSGYDKLLHKKSSLPVAYHKAFTIRRKIICPKQIDDTVRIFFSGEWKNINVFAGKTQLIPEKDQEGNTVYDITSSLKTGSTYISAVICEGFVDSFFLSVKRDKKQNIMNK